jgi:hypothetical protein
MRREFERKAFSWLSLILPGLSKSTQQANSAHTNLLNAVSMEQFRTMLKNALSYLKYSEVGFFLNLLPHPAFNKVSIQV